MNPLDDLISSSSGVPGVTPGGLGRGRAALDRAIAARARQESPARRKAAAHWFSGLRGKAIIGVAGIAAAAAAAAVVVLPSSSPHTAGGPLAGPSAKPTLKAAAQPKPSAPGQATGSLMSYTITPLNANVTAAYVFAQAAKGAQAAQYTPEGNVPLVVYFGRTLPYWHSRRPRARTPAARTSSTSARSGSANPVRRSSAITSRARHRPGRRTASRAAAAPGLTPTTRTRSAAFPLAP